MGKIYVIDMIICDNQEKNAVKAFWEQVAYNFSKKSGFLVGNLQESVNPKSHYQFISIYEWE